MELDLNEFLLLTLDLLHYNIPSFTPMIVIKAAALFLLINDFAAIYCSVMNTTTQ